MGTFLFEDVETYLKVSPSSYAVDIHTPLLILHSENDLRCPVEQAEHLFVTLRLLKRPVEFVRFPRSRTSSHAPAARCTASSASSSSSSGSTATSRADEALRPAGAGSRRPGGGQLVRAWRRRCLGAPAGALGARLGATLWVRPGEARAVDAPAGTVPADPRAWLEALSTTQERWLVGRLETQRSTAPRCTCSARRGRVARGGGRAADAAQPVGYPGWLPTRQLTDVEPATEKATAVVLWPHCAVPDSGPERARVRVSSGTRLPVVATTSGAVEVLQVDARTPTCGAPASSCTTRARPGRR